MTKSHWQGLIGRRPLLEAGLALGTMQVAGPFIISARGETPIKIGMVDPETGTYAALGDNEIRGARFALAQVNANGGILGRPVQLIVEDSAANVSQSVQKVNKLIDDDQVNFLMGSVSSAVAAADSQAAHLKNMLYVVTGGHTDPVTGSRLPLEHVPHLLDHLHAGGGDRQDARRQVRQALVFHYPGLCVWPYRAGGVCQTANRDGRYGARQFARAARQH